MGRLFSALLLTCALVCLPARARTHAVQPVFFSMLFPQLMLGHAGEAVEATAGEAVYL